MTTPKKTPLFDEHKASGARFVDFGGWKMPVFYTSTLEEHAKVREKVGIFDVSHMGEVILEGEASLEFLQFAIVGDAEKIIPGSGLYTAMVNEEGGTIDDLIVYCLEPKKYLLCVNASNTDKDYKWLCKLKDENFSDKPVRLSNESENYGQIAIQGPASKDIMSKLTSGKCEELEFCGIANLDVGGHTCLVASTGFTGEFGYELYTPKDKTAPIWRALLDAGAAPIGLGARDTLRLEASFLLYGQDISETISPIEAGIGWAVKPETGFLGAPVLDKQKKDGAARRLICFQMEEQGIPRAQMEILDREGTPVGFVTSGGVLPTVGGSGGMALVEKMFGKAGDEFYVNLRGKRKLARIVKRPLYSSNAK